ncbi:RDD family protein [Daejeonella sp. JGW-45]|uniref:RDD family protein n=1 Tax=Daejeonella sp. JGW-45 TaxID=3034148 RepID=UPI0023ED26CC|nr:RDD family protein [Daejeonella sp. JGW-45]
MEGYIVVVKGKPEGPYTMDQLKELRIKPGTFVKTAGMDDYKEAHEIPELCELLGMKTQVRRPQYFASLDVRLLAIIVDYFLVFAIYCVIATVTVLFINEKEARIIAALSGLGIIPIAKMIYSIVAEASKKQGTYGKVLMGLKVTDEAGLPITIGRSAVRNLSKLICVATLGLGYAYGFFDKRQQGIHDKIAGTLVIKDRLL